MKYFGESLRRMISRLKFLTEKNEFAVLSTSVRSIADDSKAAIINNWK